MKPRGSKPLVAVGLIMGLMIGSVAAPAEALIVTNNHVDPCINTSVLIDSTNICITAGGDLTIDAAISVGADIGQGPGLGHLSVTGGNRLSTSFAGVGNPGSDGSVTVTGVGSQWASGPLFVGGGGIGTLRIEDGGVVSGESVQVGSLGPVGPGGVVVAGRGSVIVTGDGSQWNVTTSLAVGDGGTGTLTVEKGGQVSSNSGVVGSSPISVGTVTVMDPGSLWTVAESLSVRHGSLSIKDGGQVVVGGGGSPVFGDLIVGNVGVGSLTISDGGQVSNQVGIVGSQPGSEGTVTVTGDKSKWTVTGDLFIGDAGKGTLTIADGGVVSSKLGGLGTFASGRGEVTVAGAGSRWTVAGELRIGDEGTGLLTIKEGGQVEVAGNNNAVVGSRPNSSGTVLVTSTGAPPGTRAAQWTVTGDLTIGAFGNGTLIIADGGAVTSNSGHVGAFAGGSGNVIVSGKDSTWTVAGELRVGDQGTGNVTSGKLTIGEGARIIENGVEVPSKAGGVVSSSFGDIGTFAGGQGEVTVAGAGSRWTVGGALRIGDEGTGTLTIKEGGQVTSLSGLVGSRPGSSGTVLVTNTGAPSGTLTQWTVGGALTVGAFGNGTLVIQDGGVVTSNSGHVGAFAEGSGTVIVSGKDSMWTVAGELRVGDQGTGNVTSGKLTIGEGATFINEKGAEVASKAGGVVSSSFGDIGTFAGGRGEVTVAGAGSRWNVTGELRIGDAGTGTLTIEKVGLVSSNSGTVGAQATLTGTVTVRGDFTDETGTRTPSEWSVKGKLSVGEAGKGTLNVLDGGRVSSDTGIVGSRAGSEGTVTVDGANSRWEVTGELRVGDIGKGELTIFDRAQVSSSSGVVGSAPKSVGDVLVNNLGRPPGMAAAQWKIGGDLTVGSSGEGTLIIQDGGVVMSNSGHVGAFAEGSGTVIVSGKDSNWTVAGDLRVGDRGNGTLTIGEGASVLGPEGKEVPSKAGGVVSSQSGVVGAAAGKTGTVSVGGAGSEWKVAGSLSVGEAGDGKLVSRLLIFNGGQVTSNTGTIGSQVNSIGEVTVEDKGSRWTVVGELRVGDSGKGSLVIDLGGVVTSTSAVVGSQANPNGTVSTVSVSGDGSQWDVTTPTLTGQLLVGDSGRGGLFVRGGGVVASNVAVIGSEAGSEGQVLVTGDGSRWAVTGGLTVGDAGKGSLTIAEGGRVASSVGFVNGEVKVTGAGSQWNVTELRVGENAPNPPGSLTIEDGGTVTSQVGKVGFANATEATVKVTGAKSQWILQEELRVGDTGPGALTIESGGQVSSKSGVVGAAIGPLSTVTITGADTVTGAKSQWTIQEGLQVGQSGTGLLEVEKGGVVSSKSADIGVAQGAVGVVMVIGDESKWQVMNGLNVGVSGTGGLEIEKGGKVSSETANIGILKGAVGSVTVTGDGKWTVTNELNVGVSGEGGLTIKNGGEVSSRIGTLGSQAGSTGRVTVSGDGSEWSSTRIVLGDEGDGELTIEKGGKVFSDVGTVGFQAGSTGRVTVTGDSSEWTLLLGSLAIGEAGAASLRIDGGGKVVAFRATVGSFSTGGAKVDVTAVGSVLQVLTILHVGEDKLLGGGPGQLTVSSGGTVKADTIEVGPGGKILGDGTIEGNVINMGGLIAPGFSPGTLTINGNYTQLAGLLELEVAGLGLGQFDQLLIHGLADFEGGIIEISFIDGFLPHAGDTFSFILADLGLTLAPGLAIMLAGVDSSFQFETGLQDGTFTFTALTDAREGAPHGVPEPAPLFLIAAALPLLIVLARRRIQKKLTGL